MPYLYTATKPEPMNREKAEKISNDIAEDIFVREEKETLCECISWYADELSRVSVELAKSISAMHLWNLMKLGEGLSPELTKQEQAFLMEMRKGLTHGGWKHMSEEEDLEVWRDFLRETLTWNVSMLDNAISDRNQEGVSERIGIMSSALLKGLEKFGAE